MRIEYEPPRNIFESFVAFLVPYYRDLIGDSGAGFDRQAAKASRGLGLISMEEQLKLLNGTLSIESQPQLGTTIHARVPFSPGSDSLRAAS